MLDAAPGSEENVFDKKGQGTRGRKKVIERWGNQTSDVPRGGGLRVEQFDRRISISKEKACHMSKGQNQDMRSHFNHITCTKVIYHPSSNCHVRSTQS